MATSSGMELARREDSAVAQRQPQGIGQSLSIPEMMTMADMFCKSGMFGDVRDVAKAFVKIQAGREIGVPPFAAMRGVSIIQGQAALGATLVAGRMKAHGYDWEEIRRDNEVCELRIIKPNGKTAGTSRFSMDDAKEAGLAGKDNWKKYRRSMLFARCITDAARTFAPEVFSGIPVYTPEELGNANTNEDGDVVSGSVEAQNEVRDRKLEEARAAGIETDRKPQSTSYAPNMSDAEKSFRAKLTGKYEILNVFAELKDQCQQLMGEKAGLDAYYSVLRAHKVEKSDQFKTVGEAKLCAVDLWHRVEGLKAQAAAATAESVDKSDWVPDFDAPAAVDAEVVNE